jgi:hypothetical protein
VTDPRSTYRWRKLAKQVVDAAQECVICGRPIDKQAPPRSRWSGAADHILPAVDYPHLAFDLANVMAVHAGCNAAKSARGGIVTTSTNALDNPKAAAPPCRIHEARTHPNCHPKRWIIKRCEQHGDDCPDLPASKPSSSITLS